MKSKLSGFFLLIMAVALNANADQTTIYSCQLRNFFLPHRQFSNPSAPGPFTLAPNYAQQSYAKIDRQESDGYAYNSYFVANIKINGNKIETCAENQCSQGLSNHFQVHDNYAEMSAQLVCVPKIVSYIFIHSGKEATFRSVPYSATPDQLNTHSYPFPDDYKSPMDLLSESCYLGDVQVAGRDLAANTTFQHDQLTVSNGSISFFVDTNGECLTMGDGYCAQWEILKDARKIQVDPCNNHQ